MSELNYLKNFFIQTPDSKLKLNSNLRNDIVKNSYTGSEKDINVFSGSDTIVTAIFPLTGYLGKEPGAENRLLTFANIQTISVSTTRSVSPVRTLGRSNPVGYTRGARTIAGTLVFAATNKDVFQDVFDIDLAENIESASSSIISDSLPPFSILIQFGTEKGVSGIQLLTGVTLVNYGTTYSIDDLYTEVTYSYVAQDIMPISSVNVGSVRDIFKNYIGIGSFFVKTLSTNLSPVLATTTKNIISGVSAQINTINSLKNTNKDAIKYTRDSYKVFNNRITTSLNFVEKYYENLNNQFNSLILKK